MLASDDRAVANTSGGILSMVASMNGGPTAPLKIREGVYEIGHFGSSHWPPGYDDMPMFEEPSFWCYGVCDNVDQILERCPEIAANNRQYIITLTPIVRANQPAEGGWRWHKWGEYIGTHLPLHEYLYDEKNIDQVLVYHVYLKKVVSRQVELGAVASKASA